MAWNAPILAGMEMVKRLLCASCAFVLTGVEPCISNVACNIERIRLNIQFLMQLEQPLPLKALLTKWWGQTMTAIKAPRDRFDGSQNPSTLIIRYKFDVNCSFVVPLSSCFHKLVTDHTEMCDEFYKLILYVLCLVRQYMIPNVLITSSLLLL